MHAPIAERSEPPPTTGMDWACMDSCPCASQWLPKIGRRPPWPLLRCFPQCGGYSESGLPQPQPDPTIHTFTRTRDAPWLHSRTGRPLLDCCSPPVCMCACVSIYWVNQCHFIHHIHSSSSVNWKRPRAGPQHAAAPSHEPATCGIASIDDSIDRVEWARRFRTAKGAKTGLVQTHDGFRHRLALLALREPFGSVAWPILPLGQTPNNRSTPKSLPMDLLAPRLLPQDASMRVSHSAWQGTPFRASCLCRSIHTYSRSSQSLVSPISTPPLFSSCIFCSPPLDPLAHTTTPFLFPQTHHRDRRRY